MTAIFIGVVCFETGRGYML